MKRELKNATICAFVQRFGHFFRHLCLYPGGWYEGIFWYGFGMKKPARGCRYWYGFLYIETHTNTSPHPSLNPENKAAVRPYLAPS